MALSDNQVKAAALFAEGSTTSELARECKVGIVEVLRWLEDPDFLDQVEKITGINNKQRENKALATLDELMGSPDVKERTAASRTFLNYWKTAKPSGNGGGMSVTFSGMATPKSGMEKPGGDGP